MSIERSLGQVQIEQADADARDQALYEEISASNVAQQIQVIVSGKADKRPTFSEKTITFPFPFFNRIARGQTNSDLDNPHFAIGIEVTQSTGHLILDAVIVRWIENESNVVTGAVLRLSAWAPDALKKRKFAGVLHLTFFGYGAPAEDDSDTA